MKRFGALLILFFVQSIAFAQASFINQVHLPSSDTIEVVDSWLGTQRYRIDGDFVRQRALSAALKSDREAIKVWRRGKAWHWASAAVFASCLYVVRTDQPNWSWALLGSSVLMQGVGYGQKRRAIALYNHNLR
ncbi:MAG: hypothetical protein KI786_18435 [Mameliella sp.]|nr:hypothetical protein [Phaeodactylibacter sp.]NRA50694.1 hypothetical protein [Phaeodactylibacter sp.]